MPISGIRLSASLLAITAAVMASPARAEEAAEKDGSLIVVSAKDVAQDDLAYPGSVSSISTEELDARQVQDLSTLSYGQPNVSLDQIGTFKGVANFAMRGLGVNSSIPSIDPAVGLFVDGVYMGINSGTVFDMLDVEQVDVLRGPQGVAFGRNTTGGAILVKTADPTFEREGHAGLSYQGPVDRGRGTGMVTARMVLSGPVSETVAVRMAALHSNDGGYFTNLADGSDFGEAKTTVLRGGLTWLASEALSFTVKGEWNHSRGDGAPGHNNGLFARDTFELSLNQPGFYDSDNYFTSLRADYDLGRGRLTNVFGWRKYDLSTRNDIDSSPDPIFESDTRTAQEQWSNELYYAADYGALSLTTGGYIFHQHIGYEETRDLSYYNLPTYFGGGQQDHDVYGLYAQGDFDLTEQLVLTAGLRWSREEKSAAVTYVRPREACSAVEGTCPTSGERVAGENNGFTDSRGWSNFTPRVSLSFRPTAESNLYASWTRGVRSGGYNLRITQPAAFEQVSADLGSFAFDQEKVDSYEVGAKWQSADGLAAINAAAFWMEVDGLQREVNVPSESSGLAQSIYNTADARILGGELEATLRPAKGFTLSGSVGLTDAEYRDIYFDLNSDDVIDDADLDLDLPRAPKWTWGVNASYEAELGSLGTLVASAFFQHRDRYAYTDNNWGYNSASDRIDASLALKLADPAVTISLYGRNLLDEVQFGGDTQLSFAGGDNSNGVNAPYDPHPAAGTFSPMAKGRVIGASLGYDF